jgi:Protein of unknown function (DUF3047)
MRRWRSGSAVAGAACWVAALAWAQAGSPEGALVIGAFSSLQAGAAMPDTWQPQGVSRAKPPTRYTLVDDAGVTVVRADAVASVAALSRSLKVSLSDYPLLRWRWKVANILKTSEIRSKDGDDYPARVYVMFDYPLEKLSFADRARLRLARALHDPRLPAATLCYVWDSKAPAGTIVPSSYTNLMRMMVVESGAARVNRWLEVERDVAADFRAAFGTAHGNDTPAVLGVAIATDTDNTGESAVAFYGDISFYKQKVNR